MNEVAQSKMLSGLSWSEKILGKWSNNTLRKLCGSVSFLIWKSWAHAAKGLAMSNVPNSPSVWPSLAFNLATSTSNFTNSRLFNISRRGFSSVWVKGLGPALGKPSFLLIACSFSFAFPDRWGRSFKAGPILTHTTPLFRKENVASNIVRT